MASDPLPVFVSLLPQRYFVQQIGKDLVDVQVMVRPGASPATYEPNPRQMAAIARARLYFAIGVPFERVWLKKITGASPDMKVVHTDQGIEKIAMADDHAHEDGSGAEHHRDAHQEHRGGLDPHIWLSPPLVKIQARTIVAALKSADPSHGADYQRNCERFLKKIDQLHADLTQAFSDHQGLRIMVFHPAWGYFARAYGLIEVPIEIEGKAPKPAMLKRLIQRARKERVQWVFVQPQFSKKSARLIAGEIGAQVAVADPLAEDWMANLRLIAGKFKSASK